ncbi:MAG TPA: hypothetical protein VME45_10815 [Stellaceae bacterium]|nr:hypothetical protein [Stellaceae bacterium]
MLRVVVVLVVSVIVCCLLLAAAPARAQNSDIFREEAPPPPVAAAPAPKPAPRPRVYSPPEPEIVAPPPQPQPVVAPAPSLPPASQVWARVRQIAASQGISVPLSGTPPFDVAGTPAQYRVLLGAWGPGMWQGNAGGEKIILVIQSIDGDGAIRGVVGKSEGRSTPALWAMATGTAGGAHFVLQVTFMVMSTYYGNQAVSSQAEWGFELRADGTLSGSRDHGASTIVLGRLQ